MTLVCSSSQTFTQSVTTFTQSVTSIKLPFQIDLSAVSYENDRQLVTLAQSYDQTILLKHLPSELLNHCLEPTAIGLFAKYEMEDFCWAAAQKLSETDATIIFSHTHRIARAALLNKNEPLIREITLRDPSILSDYRYFEQKCFDEEFLLRVFSSSVDSAQHQGNTPVPLLKEIICNLFRAQFPYLAHAWYNATHDFWTKEKDKVQIYFFMAHCVAQQENATRVMNIVKIHPQILQVTDEAFDEDAQPKSFFDYKYFDEPTIAKIVAKVPKDPDYFYDILCNLLKAKQLVAAKIVFSKLFNQPPSTDCEWWRDKTKITNLLFLAIEVGFTIPYDAYFYKQIVHDQLNNNKQTTLACAAIAKLQETVLTLLFAQEYKIVCNTLDRMKKQPSDYLMENFCEESLLILFEGFDTSHSSTAAVICSALNAKRTELAKMLITTSSTHIGPSAWWSDKTQKAKVFCSALKNEMEKVVENTPSIEIDVFYQDRHGKTALTYVSQIGNKKFSEALLLQGARLLPAYEHVSKFEKDFLINVRKQLSRTFPASSAYIYFLFDSKCSKEADQQLDLLRKMAPSQVPSWFTNTEEKANLLAAAIASGDETACLKLLQDKVDVNFRVNGATPLIMLSTEKQLAAVTKKLGQQGAKTETDYYGIPISTRIEWAFGENFLKTTNAPTTQSVAVTTSQSCASSSASSSSATSCSWNSVALQLKNTPPHKLKQYQQKLH